MYRTLCAVPRSLRPIIGSAASFFLSAAVIHTFACWLHPTFSLFATRSVGKFALMAGALIQVTLFTAIQQRSFARKIWHHAVAWPTEITAWRSFLYLFSLFAVLHLFILDKYRFFGWATWHTTAFSLIPVRWPALLGGMIGTFLVAWSEELIFRGVIFEHLRRTLSLWPSTLIAALLFSLSHDLSNPLRLLTTQWQLGLGLFLLGTLLTMIRVYYRSIAASAGAHAGLVLIKVVLRKIPLLTIATGSTYLFPIDLRESLIVHAVMGVTIALIYRNIVFNK